MPCKIALLSPWEPCSAGPGPCEAAPPSVPGGHGEVLLGSTASLAWAWCALACLAVTGVLSPPCTSMAWAWRALARLAVTGVLSPPCTSMALSVEGLPQPALACRPCSAALPAELLPRLAPAPRPWPRRLPLEGVPAEARCPLVASLLCCPAPARLGRSTPFAACSDFSPAIPRPWLRAGGGLHRIPMGGACSCVPGPVRCCWLLAGTH